MFIDDKHISTINESLRYSQMRIREYPHKEYEHKQMSLTPVEDAMNALAGGDTLDPTDRLHRQANAMRKQIADLDYRLSETASRLVEVERERDGIRERIKTIINQYERKQLT